MEIAALDELIRLVGSSNVVVDGDMRAGHEIDWTRRWRGHCDAVVRPHDTTQVAMVLEWCGHHGIAVVPQGGNTGLVGGGIPPGTSDRPVIVLSTRALTEMGSLDDLAGQITVGAGVTLAALADAVRGSGWEPAVDLSARGSATIGGMTATNAGGTRVVRHGMMRRTVVGIEAVLADGSVISSLRGLVKDNTGYDLTGLLVGSEGTLGVITRVRLQLVPTRADRCTIAVSCASWGDALVLASAIRRLDGVEALEAVDGATARLVGSGEPTEPAAVELVVEWAGDGDPPARLVEAIGQRRHRVATDGPSRLALWQVRDGATEAIARRGVPHKYDVTLPLREIERFVSAVGDVVASAAREVFVFGHLGDGNLHVNVLGARPDDEALDDEVLRLVADMGGSISAEHGIGRMKRRHLHLARSPEEIAAFQRVKAALDPGGLLNPGVLFDRVT